MRKAEKIVDQYGDERAVGPITQVPEGLTVD